MKRVRFSIALKLKEPDFVLLERLEQIEEEILRQVRFFRDLISSKFLYFLQFLQIDPESCPGVREIISSSQNNYLFTSKRNLRSILLIITKLRHSEIENRFEVSSKEFRQLRIRHMDDIKNLKDQLTMETLTSSSSY